MRKTRLSLLWADLATIINSHQKTTTCNIENPPSNPSPSGRARHVTSVRGAKGSSAVRERVAPDHRTPIGKGEPQIHEKQSCLRSTCVVHMMCASIQLSWMSHKSRPRYFCHASDEKNFITKNRWTNKIASSRISTTADVKPRQEVSCTRVCRKKTR